MGYLIGTFFLASVINWPCYNQIFRKVFMSSYKELLQKKEQLEQEIAIARGIELSEAVAKVRAIVSEFGLSASDVFGRGPSIAKGRTVAAKYRDPQTGATWTGRGKAPKWIQGKDRQQFEIA